MSFHTTAPVQVAPDEVFTVRIAPQGSEFPDTNPSPLGQVPVHFLENVNFMYELPANASLESVSIVPGTGFGTQGTPTVSVTSSPPSFASRAVSSYNPARIVLFVPRVPKNPQPPNNATPFQLPAIDVTLRATGPIGSSVSSRVPGVDEPNSGYVFQASSIAMAQVYCWPQGNVQAPLLWSTTILSGSSTFDTTTALSVDPTAVPAGNEVALSATVGSEVGPMGAGVVRFNDGPTVLGFADVDEGVASLSAALHTIGSRTITATYVGAPGFASSTSPPVNVSVTNPAARTRAQVSVTPTPQRLVLSGLPTATVAVAVTPTGIDTAVPSGIVRLYDNDVLVDSATLSATATASFTLNPGAWRPAGHQFRVEYLGDTEYFAVWGSAPLPVTDRDGANFAALDQPLSGAPGSIGLNAASGGVPGGSVLNSSFRTDETGTQTLDGTLVFASATYATPSGSVTGQLAQVGPATGQIAPGADGAASLSTDLFFQVTGATVGGSAVQFASTCAVGPFDVDLSGTRTGTAGALTLATAGFFVPPVAPGGCVTAEGVSMADMINGLLVGGSTNLALTLTPPAAGAATQVSAVSASLHSSFYGQPVTLSATVSREDGLNFVNGFVGTVEFWAAGAVVASGSALGAVGPTKTATISLPAVRVAALPLGQLQLTARFVPSEPQKTVLAASEMGAPLAHQVFDPLPKVEPILTLEIPAEVHAGQPTDLVVTIDPAPNAGTSPAPTLGTIRVFDDLAADPNRAQVSIAGRPDIQLSSVGSDGRFTVAVGLAPGEHSLRAVYTPSITSAWWWGITDSEAVPHRVVGDLLPTAVEITTSLYGNQYFGGTTSLYASFSVNPAPRFAGGLFYYQLNDDEPDRAGVTLANLLTVTLGNSEIPPGINTIKAWYDPDFWSTTSATGSPGDLGWATSPVATYTFERVTPGTPGPMQTATELHSITPSPVPVGVAWSELRAQVNYRSEGSVEFRARNTGTDELVVLGSATPGITTNSTTGRGIARLLNPAATASLPVGAYEVTAHFTPTNSTNFAPSASDPLVVQVVNPSAKVTSSTSLEVVTPSPSARLDPVSVKATVSPAGAGAGTVRFFSGDTEVGSAPVTRDVAEAPLWALPMGSQSLTAHFEPANTALVNPSTSSAVTHVVTEPGVETSTTLSVSPEGSSIEGDEVTLSASVDPVEAVGSVEFFDDDDLIGSAPVVDGVASIVVDDLSLGEHGFTASFVPADPLELSPSVSEPVTHSVTEAPVGPVETGTTLAVSPEGSAVVGSDVTLTATVTPSAAAGTVSFLDGDTVVAGPVAVTDGSAEVVVDQLGLGNHSLVVAFDPDDPEAYEGSASPAQSYEITAPDPENPPVMTCMGADEASIGLLVLYLADTGGTVTVPTPVISTVPAELDTGSSADVAFEWSVTLPEELAALPVELQTHMRLINMNLAIEASGGSSQSWAFPAEIPTIEDTFAPIVLNTEGSVTASSDADILYRLKTPALITVSVDESPLGLPQVDVNLTCDFANNIVAVTEVNGGDVTAPGAPTGVTAEAGPLMAHVSWTPPANDGGSPITGYTVTASPGGKTVTTSADVTHVDVIGLTEGQNYTFTVQAMNEVGPGEASEPSSEVTPGPGENFSDVQPGHPFYAEVEWLAATGITQGMGDGSFGANLTLTRQAMAAFLYRMAGEPNGADPTCTTMPFTDVSLDNAFCGEITWLKDAGITTGNDDGSFNPTGGLTRQAMSAFLYRFAGNPNGENPTCDTDPFPDVPTTNPFCGEIAWMAEVGITTTPSTDNFRPNDALTRQAMAAFLYRYTTVIPTEL